MCESLLRIEVDKIKLSRLSRETKDRKIRFLFDVESIQGNSSESNYHSSGVEKNLSALRDI